MVYYFKIEISNMKLHYCRCMDDFISLGQDKQKTEEFDVLKLTADSKRPPEKKQTEDNSVPVAENSASEVKPFYPRCKRILTRAPFRTTPTASTQPSPSLPVETAQKCADKPLNNGATAKTTSKTTNGHPVTPPKSASSVAQISLQELMSVDEKDEPPVKKGPTVPDSDERLVRLRNMLKQAEIEKVTLRGYVADLQAKLAAVPKRTPTKCAESQTDENGLLILENRLFFFFKLHDNFLNAAIVSNLFTE